MKFQLDGVVSPTKDQLKSGLLMVAAVAESIREAGEIPSGTLYAMLIDRVDITGYESIIRVLKNADLIEEKGNLLRWIGPEISK